MSATDELRRMLDERGATKGRLEYSPCNGESVTAWDFGDGEFPREKEASFTEFEDGVTLVRIWNITPAQAIAATLGTGTCRNVHEPPKDTTFWPAPHFKCSECGATHVSMEYVFYCPNCGRKVVVE